MAGLTVPKEIPSIACCESRLSEATGTKWTHLPEKLLQITFFCWIWLSIPSCTVWTFYISTCLSVFFSLLLCFCPSLYPRPPSLPSYTLCLTHLLSARQVYVAKRQAMSDGLLLRERPLSIMISHLPLPVHTYKLDFSYGNCSGVVCREISADCVFEFHILVLFPQHIIKTTRTSHFNREFAGLCFDTLHVVFFLINISLV